MITAEHPIREHVDSSCESSVHVLAGDGDEQDQF